jgi:hypothetical protein
MVETALRRGNFELIMVWSDEGVKREIDGCFCRISDSLRALVGIATLPMPYAA